jgi:hypothetical protein
VRVSDDRSAFVIGEPTNARPSGEGKPEVGLSIVRSVEEPTDCTHRHSVAAPRGKRLDGLQKTERATGIDRGVAN